MSNILDGASSDWLAEFVGSPSGAGIRVTYRNALQVAPVWRIVVGLARDVARLPVKVYRKSDNGSRIQVDDHPVSYLLRRRPNPEMTPLDLKSALVFNAVLHGNGFIYIRRLPNGQPVELWPVESPLVSIERDSEGQLVYRVTLRSSAMSGVTPGRLVVAAQDMVHVKSVTSDGLQGIPFYRVAKNDIAMMLAIQRFSLVFFRNYARPGMAVILKRALNEQAMRQLRESFERSYTGENAHRVAVLQGDADIKTFSINAREAELSDLVIQTMRNIASFGCVPTHLVGDPARTSYSSLEQESLNYLHQSLDYWLCAIEQEFNSKLLSDSERDLFIEFERSAAVRMDLEGRFRAYQVGIQSGFLTRNEVRNRENLPPIPGGDRPFVPLNLAEGQPVDSAPGSSLSDAPSGANSQQSST
ncbi:MAG: phage portal protein [Gemmatales bacterium]|nr:phage portal protein [Gemmatales bacterium]MDW8175135.1 phage portal protein [Gemmatales bacterium]